MVIGSHKAGTPAKFLIISYFTCVISLQVIFDGWFQTAWSQETCFESYYMIDWFLFSHPVLQFSTFRFILPVLETAEDWITSNRSQLYRCPLKYHFQIYYIYLTSIQEYVSSSTPHLITYCFTQVNVDYYALLHSLWIKNIHYYCLMLSILSRKRDQWVIQERKMFIT